MLKKNSFHWCIELLICRSFGTATVLWTSTTHGWSREPLMCSTLMFGTLKLGLIDLQSAPQINTTCRKVPLQASLFRWNFALISLSLIFLRHCTFKLWMLMVVVTFRPPGKVCERTQEPQQRTRQAQLTQFNSN